MRRKQKDECILVIRLNFQNSNCWTWLLSKTLFWKQKEVAMICPEFLQSLNDQRHIKVLFPHLVSVLRLGLYFTDKKIKGFWRGSAPFRNSLILSNLPVGKVKNVFLTTFDNASLITRIHLPLKSDAENSALMYVSMILPEKHKARNPDSVLRPGGTYDRTENLVYPVTVLVIVNWVVDQYQRQQWWYTDLLGVMTSWLQVSVDQISWNPSFPSTHQTFPTLPLY